MGSFFYWFQLVIQILKQIVNANANWETDLSAQYSVFSFWNSQPKPLLYVATDSCQDLAFDFCFYLCQKKSFLLSLYIEKHLIIKTIHERLQFQTLLLNLNRTSYNVILSACKKKNAYIYCSLSPEVLVVEQDTVKGKKCTIQVHLNSSWYSN